MKTSILLITLGLSACVASAEARRSSRNLAPLTRQPGSASAGTVSGNSGMCVAAPSRETARETVTKVTFLGPKSGWGFVQTSSPYYTPQGKNSGKLPGGTLFTYNDVKPSSKNAMLVCSVKRGEAWEGPYLLDCTDVAAYEGHPDTFAPETIKNLGQYFTLKGKIADRKEALEDEALSANPYFNTARQSQQAYQDSITKAAEMERQMLTMTGARKTQADEALRAFKYEQVRIKAKADQAAAAYKAWKVKHPIDPAKLAADPQLKALEQELQAAAAKIPGLIPSAS